VRVAFLTCLFSFLSLLVFAQNTSYAVTSANDYIGVYQKYIGGIRGGECPMYPSCSNYGLKAFRDKSFVEAMFLTSDRLIRCGHDHKNYGLTFTQKGYKFLDLPYYSTIPDSLSIGGRNHALAFGDRQRDDEDVKFVKWLINNEYFQEAVLEINRLFYKEDKFSPELLNNLLIALTAEDRLEEALFAYGKQLDRVR
jgi:putative component of membrane protein insertase Oxa1/YidC/SpoIIIJ protein YidD